MASLSLPPPRNSTASRSVGSSNGVSVSSTSLVVVSSVHSDDEDEEENEQINSATTPIPTTTRTHDKKPVPPCRAPNYEERCKAATEVARMKPAERKHKKLFVPRALADFDDGGAFPEIHVAQYPRHMGNPHLKKKSAASGGITSAGGQPVSRAIVNVEVDKNGEISYDAIVKGGTNADKTVYSRYEDMRGGEAKAEDVALPTEEEEAETADRTQAALMKILSEKTALNKPTGSAIVNAETSKNIEEKTQFIKYTPRPDAPGYNPAAAQRVIQMVPAQVDPMMPPKHKHKKAPRGPAEDPVPVLHAPPQKLTKEERDKWNVPACISNWKNSRGYTIPLDKRLAADGRGLREHSINPNFASLSESLYVAERQARQEVRLRAQVQKKLALQEKDRREEELRELANQARLERSGLSTVNPRREDDDESDDHGDGGVSRKRRPSLSDDDDNDHSASGSENERDESDDAVAARQRERLRQERRREREKELRQENNMELKKRKLEAERDVSEKIALGVHTGSGGAGEVDSRLYNQSAGMDSGFGADDEYNTYSKPLFDRQGVTSASIYRPTRGETEHNADETYDKLMIGATSKFQPSKGFAGAEGGTDIQAGPRNAPVQFEKSKN
ncbi:SKIP/SNW domain containing protein [Nitzschia inconspicua]|uniref:SKIP/SNW domain containing protein n=1 Tax=Nitzschia inconspicua TaxID=303405 RepID=A0A9K3PQR5_9STRA|nr:SKIP/SNW domain containing protein [Nitzschia inconspicua]